MLPILAITLADGITITFVMPIAPDMVRSFGVDEVDVGYSAGMLASGQCLRRTIDRFNFPRKTMRGIGTRRTV